MLSHHEIFFLDQDYVQLAEIFFFKMIEQKLKKIERSIPPKNLCFGGADGLATENSGNVVGGKKF